MNQDVRMADITWPEYHQRITEDASVLLLPVGALEQHGPHLPLNTDVVLPSAIAERVADRIGGLVAPPVSYGYKPQQRSAGGQNWPGTTSLDGATLVMTIRDILKEFGRHGARKIVIMEGHYENAMFVVEGIDLALREFRTTGVDDIKILRIAFFEFTSDDSIATVWPEGFRGWALEHAGIMETSAMLYLHPETVHMERVPEHPPAQFPPYDVFPATPENVPAVPSSGALVSAKFATREKGELLVEEWISGIAAAASREFGISDQGAAVAERAAS